MEIHLRDIFFKAEKVTSSHGCKLGQHPASHKKATLIDRPGHYAVDDEKRNVTGQLEKLAGAS
jgi:hypothetical protein